MNEFDLIQSYFKPLQHDLPFVSLGQGDDCALFAPDQGLVCAVSTDTLVSGVHFLPDMPPQSLGHRALAVSLSDLAAMGAAPRACLLAITMPSVCESWLSDFSRGFGELANTFNLSLMGGDTTFGPLSITVTVFGEVDRVKALSRSSAKVGEQLWVSGQLGKAWCGLQSYLPAHKKVPWLSLTSSPLHKARRAFDWPLPRIELGLGLLGIASAAIDLSDGLAGDAKHLSQSSGVSLQIDLDRLGIFQPLRDQAPNPVDALKIALSAGDDYELLFTAPPQKASAIDALGRSLGLALQVIGEVLPKGEPVDYISSSAQYQQQIKAAKLSGYQHFTA